MKLRNDAAVVLPVGGAGDSGFFVERGGVIQESSMESILVLVLSRTTLPGGATWPTIFFSWQVELST